MYPVQAIRFSMTDAFNDVASNAGKEGELLLSTVANGEIPLQSVIDAELISHDPEVKCQAESSARLVSYLSQHLIGFSMQLAKDGQPQHSDACLQHDWFGNGQSLTYVESELPLTIGEIDEFSRASSAFNNRASVCPGRRA